MGTEVKKTNAFGQKYTDYYDDEGKLVHTSFEKKTFLGGTIHKNVTSNGETIGYSKDMSGPFGSGTQHFDNFGGKTGFTDNKDLSLGVGPVQNFSNFFEDVGSKRKSPDKGFSLSSIVGNVNLGNDAKKKSNNFDFFNKGILQ